MLKFYYNPTYKYTNRTIIDVSSDTDYRAINYENIDSPDTINGHLIYTLDTANNEPIPTYIVDEGNSRRYFVSGITQLRTGKFQLSLLRDIVSEAPNVWNQEQAYIAAGKANDYCKYKIWNLPFTNTKVGQQRLDFGGKSSFFVFYVNEQTISSNMITESDFQIGYSTLPGITGYDYAVEDLDDIPYIDFAGQGPIKSWRDLKGYVDMAVFNTQGSINPSTKLNVLYENATFSDTLGTIYSNTTNYLKTPIYMAGGYSSSTAAQNFVHGAMKSTLETYRDSLGTYEAQAKIDALDAYVDKIIRVDDPLDPNNFYFYKLTSQKTVIAHDEQIANTSTTTFTTQLQNSADVTAVCKTGETWANVGTGHFQFQSTEEQTEYVLDCLGHGTTFDFTFKADVRKLPKSAVRCVNIVSDSTVSDQDLMQALMMCQANPGVDAVEGTDANIGRIIDIQYLPFSIATDSDSNANFTVGTHQMGAVFLDNDDILYTTSLSTLTNINKETDSIMIVSPSRRSQFKFSPYNNDGLMVFDTKITLRPNQSIIYIRPTTQGLLLQDWDDKDCLIIQEDFSLTTINSAWTNYVYNNRNYQNAFNLQIQTKEFERSWERRIEQEQMKSDAWTARNISSQKAQTYTGNLPIISSIAGAVGAAWKDSEYMQMAQLDREYNEALYQKSVEVARTQFEYQLDNVKSQPLIPNTITSIDVKMLDGVYLEFYSTNSTELQSIASYYQYNGNRIDNYGTFNQYWGPFVRGKIIIAQNYTQPEIDELNRRLELGIFTGGV